MKPMLASDWDENKVKFPVIFQFKIDGVRALNIDGLLVGRSLKRHANRYITQMFSHPEFAGFDGELAAEHQCHPDLCRLTSSAVSRIEGQPYVLWWLFDYITEETKHLPYSERYERLQLYIKSLYDIFNEPHNLELKEAYERIRLVPMVLVHNMGHLEECDSKALFTGFEGSIIRDPDGKHKQGRSTVREGGFLRIKRFIEEEATIISITEGQSNQNEATTGLLGQTERSSHKENMVPNGMVGSFECIDKKTGKQITVSAGTMPHEDRIKYFQNQNLVLGKLIKYKHFPKGVKDKPRFPTFQCIRSESDIG